MKTDKGWDEKLLDWAFKALLGITLYLVKDMHTDIKELREQIPAMKADIDNLKDKDLMEKFRRLEGKSAMKDEKTITYDSMVREDQA